jgi:TatD DNase family protein
MIDSHAHISFDISAEYTDRLVQNFKTQGGTHIIDIVTEIKELSSTLETVSRNKGIVSYCFGIHPERAYVAKSDSIEEKRQLLLTELTEMKSLKNESLKGIGETGFDIYRCEENMIGQTLELQKELLDAHMEVAESLKLPIVIHARGKDIQDNSMHEYAIEYFKKRGSHIPIYFHSFGAGKDLLTKILDINGFIGINGIITYSGSSDMKEALRFAPADKYVLETDSPFLTPSNLDRALLQDKTRNEPLSIYWIAKVISKITGKNSEQVISETTHNATRLFSL